MRQNPYSLLFGKAPNQVISRAPQANQVIDSFSNEIAPQQIYLITGVRGCGKTVFMTEIANRLAQDKRWITIELNQEKDMLEMFAASLCSEDHLAKLFQNASINLSFFGFGLSVSNAAPITDIEVALARMLETIKKHGKKVLITIDEVTTSKQMRIFISAFQILLRKDLPVFLLMTGLYDHIYELQNEETLTFLYRAPRIDLKPLNGRTIAENYKQTMHLPDEKALEMAKLTKGYSFAFQVLGHLTYEQGDFSAKVVSEYRQYLEQYSYEKIWSELSQKDKYVTYGIAKTETGKIADIRKYLNLETNQFNPYRIRLIRKGLVDGSVYGYLRFTLPLFEEFAVDSYEMENDTYL